ncbi:hydroxyethylthiazole kinase [Frondihabitans sucicola]|uniref:Hydroxyethylthiazole kinase n=1 Tax=Frondihabitans sucicola TaxID=1268041 RepID=A0ABM8GQK8_9MICO|nr:hydroxyethylthiazole kinase [Frondihabitans sucicola]BDZ50713.1 hydroxyethylthiazole kinase [Frondihabitans sucicola]
MHNSALTPPVPLPTASALAEILDRVRSRSPLVQCLTNIVVAPWTANVLLAAGAAPAMVDNPHEAASFAAVADGILVNLGTPTEETARAMRLTVAEAAESSTPWVLDPVAAGGLAWRTALAFDLLERNAPAIVRGNASEILALSGGRGGRGVDSSDSPEAALPAALDLARRSGTVVAVSGPVDHLTGGGSVVRIANGHPVMTRVTGVGCALGALMAATSGVTEDALLASAAATAILTVSADRAARTSALPGSFAVALLDELALLTPEGLEAEVALSAAAGASA